MSGFKDIFWFSEGQYHIDYLVFTITNSIKICNSTPATQINIILTGISGRAETTEKL